MERTNCNCYIFGAGASSAEGLPGTADFFARAYEGLGPTFVRSAKGVWTFLERVFGVPITGVDSFHYLPPVDEVISLVDHCIDAGQGLGHGYDPARLMRVREWLQQLLCAALDEAVERAPDQGPHNRFVHQLASGRDAERVGLISLNYDTLLDRAITGAGLGLDYGFYRPDWESRPGSLMLAKLHGSLNWALCPACDHVEVLDTRVAHLLPRAPVCCSHCGNPRLQGVIVAPTLRKRYTVVQLKHVWSLAFDMLSRACQIVFVGYSLPPADAPVFQLIMRAVLVRADRPAIHVINHTNNTLSPQEQSWRQEAVTDRFRRLFGPAVTFDFNGFHGQIKNL